jgi:hypothetical protein
MHGLVRGSGGGVKDLVILVCAFILSLFLHLPTTESLGMHGGIGPGFSADIPVHQCSTPV